MIEHTVKFIFTVVEYVKQKQKHYSYNCRKYEFSLILYQNGKSAIIILWYEFIQFIEQRRMRMEINYLRNLYGLGSSELTSVINTRIVKATNSLKFIFFCNSMIENTLNEDQLRTSTSYIPYWAVYFFTNC